jgi:hypothetical protein
LDKTAVQAKILDRILAMKKPRKTMPLGEIQATNSPQTSHQKTQKILRAQMDHLRTSNLTPVSWTLMKAREIQGSVNRTRMVIKPIFQTDDITSESRILLSDVIIVVYFDSKLNREVSGDSLLS